MTKHIVRNIYLGFYTCDMSSHDSAKLSDEMVRLRAKFASKDNQ